MLSRAYPCLPWLLLLFTGCAAHRPAPPRLAAPRAEAPAAAAPRSQSDVSGVWDWVHRSQNEQGDLRIEQEEWHLRQDGGRLSGYYDRQVVTLSTDQRPFRCNGALGYTKNTRVKIAGQVEGERVVLREIAADAPQHPCDSGARSLMSYVGEVEGNSLRLQFAPGGQQYLTRRSAGAPAPGAAQAERSAGAVLGGDWEWELSTVDADGDLRTEREEWHLAESEAGLSGTYERTVRRSRPGGTFTCNGAPEILQRTVYTLRGQRFGDRLTLSEVDFKAQPGPCDNALRRLDSYQGSLAQSGDELLLSWGSGSQLLRRKK